MRLIDAVSTAAMTATCPKGMDLDSFIAGMCAVLDRIAEAPTVDAVPVVRCGECSHSEVCKMDDGDVRYCHIFEMQTEDDYYCADGKRKDDE